MKRLIAAAITPQAFAASACTTAVAFGPLGRDGPGRRALGRRTASGAVWIASHWAAGIPSSLQSPDTGLLIEPGVFLLTLEELHGSFVFSAASAT